MLIPEKLIQKLKNGGLCSRLSRLLLNMKKDSSSKGDARESSMGGFWDIVD